jgi:hypothetical protein
MNLLEKIELFYKLAQQLESEVDDNSIVDGELEPEHTTSASVKSRMKKLAALAKGSKTK